MELSEFSLHLLVLFFPGLICAWLFTTLTEHRMASLAPFLLTAFVLGFACYLLLAMSAEGVNYVLGLGGDDALVVSFFQALQDEAREVSWIEILSATLMAVLLAGVLSALWMRKTLHGMAQAVKVSKMTGEVDVWNYLCNSEDFEWVTLRDFNNDLAYQGWVEAFSFYPDRRELLMREVAVFRNGDGEKLYDVDTVYVSPEEHGFTVELVSNGYVLPGEKNERAPEESTEAVAKGRTPTEGRREPAAN